MCWPIDRTPLTEAQRQLAGRFFPLATNRANRVAEDFPRLRDAIHSAASLALVQAARRFDPTGPASFDTYAGRLIDLRIKSAIRPGTGPAREPAQLGNIAGKAEWDHCFEGLADPRDDFAMVDGRDAAEALLARFPARQAEALRLVVLDGLEQQEAAKRMGCSFSFVSRLLKACRALLEP